MSESIFHACVSRHLRQNPALDFREVCRWNCCWVHVESWNRSGIGINETRYFARDVASATRKKECAAKQPFRRPSPQPRSPRYQRTLIRENVSETNQAEITGSTAAERDDRRVAANSLCRRERGPLVLRWRKSRSCARSPQLDLETQACRDLAGSTRFMRRHGARMVHMQEHGGSHRKWT